MRRFSILCLLIGGLWQVKAQVPFSNGGFSPGTNPNTKVTTGYDVDLHTGVLDVTVPLATIGTASMSVPIGLNYKARGVKVDQIAGEAGLGWQIYGGPIITREVRGLPDCTKNWSGIDVENFNFVEIRTSGFFTRYIRRSTVSNGIGTYNERLRDRFLNSEIGMNQIIRKSDYHHEFHDTEPDVFTLNLPSGSVKFIYDDQEKRFKSLGVSNVKIEFEIGLHTPDVFKELGSFTHIPYDAKVFKIWDDLGNYYEFAKPELTVIDDIYSGRVFNRVAYNSAWKITKMRDASNREILFKYDKNLIVYQNLAVTTPKAIAEGQWRLASQAVYVYQELLTEVESPLEKIILTYGNHRPDLTLGKKLNSVVLQDRFSGKLKNSIAFKYDFVYNNSVPGVYEWGFSAEKIARLSGLFDELPETDKYPQYYIEGDIENANSWRMYLSQVQEYDNEGKIARRPYRFEYKNKRLPNRISFHKDHWGYFKEVEYSGNLVFPFPKQYSTGSYPLIGEDISNAPTTISVEGLYKTLTTFALIDRNVSEIDCQSGLLSGIKYPLDGEVKFSYESNRFIDPTLGEIFVGGLRVKQIDVIPENKQDNTSIITHYEYEDGKAFQLPVYDQTFTSIAALENMYGDAIGYEKVKVFQTGNGKTEYTYHTPLNYQDYTEGGTNSSTLKPFTYFSPKQLPNGDIEPYSVIDDIKTFDEQGHVLIETKYEYETIAINKNGEIQKESAISIRDNGNSIRWNQYSLFMQVALMPSKVINKAYSQVVPSRSVTTSQTTEYTIIGENMYTRSSTYEGADGAMVKTMFTYPIDYPIEIDNSNYDSETWALYTARQKRLLQIPVETTTEIKKPHWNDFRLVGSTLNSYDTKELLGYNTIEFPSGEDKTPVNLHLKQVYSLELDKAIDKAIFNPVFISGTQDKQLTRDSRYALESTYEQYDRYNNLLQATGRSGLTIASIWGYERSLPMATCAGCQVADSDELIGNEFSYYGFEYNVNDQDRDYWMYTSEHFAVNEAYTGLKSFEIPAGGNSGERGVVHKAFRPSGQHHIYTFSARVKASGLGDNKGLIRIYPSQLSDAQFNTLPTNIVKETRFGASNGEWQYIEVDIDWDEVSNHSTVSNIADYVLYCDIINEDQSTSFFVDDLMFRPKNAIISYNAYDLVYGITSKTSANQKTSRYQYDSFGRILTKENFKGDLTHRYQYSFGEEKAYHVQISLDRKLGTKHLYYQASAVWPIIAGDVDINQFEYEWTFIQIRDGVPVVTTKNGVSVSLEDVHNDYYTTKILLTVKQGGEIISQDRQILLTDFVEEAVLSISSQWRWVNKNTIRFEVNNAGSIRDVRWTVNGDATTTTSPIYTWGIPVDFNRLNTVPFDLNVRIHNSDDYHIGPTAFLLSGASIKATKVGDDFVLEAEVVDDFGEVLSYEWVVNDVTLSNHTSTISLPVLNESNYNIVLLVKDEDGKVVFSPARYTISVSLLNQGN